MGELGDSLQLKPAYDPTMPRLWPNNRVPAQHLSDTGRCGSCKATLPPVSEPIEVDATAFAAIAREAKVRVLVDFLAEWCGPVGWPHLKSASLRVRSRDEV